MELISSITDFLPTQSKASFSHAAQLCSLWTKNTSNNSKIIITNQQSWMTYHLWLRICPNWLTAFIALGCMHLVICRSISQGRRGEEIRCVLPTSRHDSIFHARYIQDSLVSFSNILRHGIAIIRNCCSILPIQKAPSFPTHHIQKSLTHSKGAPASSMARWFYARPGHSRSRSLGLLEKKIISDVKGLCFCEPFAALLQCGRSVVVLECNSAQRMYSSCLFGLPL